MLQLKRIDDNKGRATHRASRTHEYLAWKNMRARCYSPTASGYENYGGRGIKVCDRWLYSSANFISDMGERPSDRHSLDRIDNSADYSPENCRWATRKEQQNNQRGNIVLELNGVRRNLTEWASGLGMSPNTLTKRKNLGWEDKDILTKPVDQRLSEIGRKGLLARQAFLNGEPCSSEYYELTKGAIK